jgi:ribonuclease HI
MPLPDSQVWSIYCDGGARGNPGPAASAFIVYDSHHQEIHRQGIYLGQSTNNQAEYTAVLTALQWLTDQRKTGTSIQLVNFYLDSLLIVNQISGIFKVKDLKLKPLYYQIISLKNSMSQIRITFLYLPRAQNAAADYLVNTTIDSSSM